MVRTYPFFPSVSRAATLPSPWRKRGGTTQAMMLEGNMEAWIRSLRELTANFAEAYPGTDTAELHNEILYQCYLHARPRPEGEDKPKERSNDLS